MHSLTQLLAHTFSNSFNSGAHTCFAFSSSFTLSIMPCLSRHAKKLSRPSQHCALADRFGAMNPPSFEGSGAARLDSLLLDQPNKPILFRVAMKGKIDGVGAVGKSWLDLSCRIGKMTDLDKVPNTMQVRIFDA